MEIIKLTVGKTEEIEPDDLTSKKSPDGKIVHACMYCIDEHSLESWEDA